MPTRAGLRDQRQLDRQLEIGLQLDRLAVQRLRRQTAQPGVALPLAREGGDRAARRGEAWPATGLSTTVPLRAVHHREVAGLDRVREPGRAEHRRHAERAQHDRGMAVGAAFLGGDAGEPRRIEQCGVGRPQRLADQDGALRQAGEAAERLRGSGCAPGGGAISRTSSARRSQARRWSSAGMPGSAWPRMAPAIASASVHHRAFGRQQRLLDAPPRRRGSAATGPACGYRRRSAARFPPGFPPAAPPGGRAAWQLLARLRDGGVQPGALGGDVGGVRSCGG